MDINSKKILIVTGGSVNKLEPFFELTKEFDRVKFVFASLSDLLFESIKGSSEFKLLINEHDVASFNLIYIRVVGERFESASLLVNYAVEHGVRVVDKLYGSANLLPTSISKAAEMKVLIENGIPLPVSFFAKVSEIVAQAQERFEFPFVIKSTSGKKARDVWSPKNQQELEDLSVELERLEKKEKKLFFAQQIVKASQRIRVLVVGNRVVGAITRPTKYRKRYLDKVNGDFLEGIRAPINPVPEKLKNIALKATKALKLEIAGVDFMIEDESGDIYVLEVNAAPSWKLIAKDCGINIEREVLKYIVKIVKNE